MATSFRDDARPKDGLWLGSMHCRCAINEVGTFNHLLDFVALQAVLFAPV
jgi:hypothetical protein